MTEANGSSHLQSPHQFTHHGLSSASWDGQQSLSLTNTLEKQLNISKRCTHSCTSLLKRIHAIFLALAQGYLGLEIQVSTKQLMALPPMLRCKTCSFSSHSTEHPWPVGYMARGMSGEENKPFNSKKVSAKIRRASLRKNHVRLPESSICHS